MFDEKQNAIAALKESRHIAPAAAHVVATRQTGRGFYAIVLAENQAEAHQLQNQLIDGGIKANLIDRSGRLALGLQAQ